jgi:hypothetical protein
MDRSPFSTLDCPVKRVTLFIVGFDSSRNVFCAFSRASSIIKLERDLGLTKIYDRAVIF